MVSGNKMSERNDQKNEKIVKLVKQVKTLSKIVNELQAEVDNLKSSASNKNNVSISKEPKTAEANGPKVLSKEPKTTEANGSKTNRFQRLNIFRKDNKTKEVVAAPKNDSPKSQQTRIDNKNSHPKQVTNQSTLTEPSEDESHRRDRSIQSVPLPKEVEFSCFVETCTQKTDNNYFEDSASSQENAGWESNYDSSSTCSGCHKKKKKKKTKKHKLKFKKSEAGKCAKNCPYLDRDNKDNRAGKCAKDCPYLHRDGKDDKNKKKKYKSKQKHSSVESCCKDQSRASKSQQCKNKKTMVNFTNNDKAAARKFVTSNDNFEEGSTQLRLLDRNGMCTKVKDTYCKRCSKKCKTKSVLKIKKAILTRDPPVIIVSPREC